MRTCEVIPLCVKSQRHSDRVCIRSDRAVAVRRALASPSWTSGEVEEGATRTLAQDAPASCPFAGGQAVAARPEVRGTVRHEHATRGFAWIDIGNQPASRVHKDGHSRASVVRVPRPDYAPSRRRDSPARSGSADCADGDSSGECPAWVMVSRINDGIVARGLLMFQDDPLVQTSNITRAEWCSGRKGEDGRVTIAKFRSRARPRLGTRGVDSRRLRSTRNRMQSAVAEDLFGVHAWSAIHPDGRGRGFATCTSAPVQRSVLRIPSLSVHFRGCLCAFVGHGDGLAYASCRPAVCGIPRFDRADQRINPIWT
jgi:hypothetical protein